MYIAANFRWPPRISCILVVMIKTITGTHIGAICTDIDGTLLDSRRELSVQTIQAIQRVKNAIPVILASSRMPSAMRHLQRTLDILQQPLICYNGAYVLRYDQHDDVVVVSSTKIPLVICSQILDTTRDMSVHVSLYVNDLWYAPLIDQWTTREATITKVSPMIMIGDDVLAAWAKTDEGAHKIMIMGDADEIAVLEQYLSRRFTDELHIYHSKSTYLEIAPKTISKASALEQLLHKHYPDIRINQVMAFGDNYNDIEMIKEAGIGIAVANARDEVKAVANEITTDSKIDGVANAINKHFGITNYY